MTQQALTEPQRAGEGVAGRTEDQYVTFYLNQEAFAFPMSEVIEIVRVPATIDVPMTPPALVGLANLRGKVLTILDLRRMLNLPGAEHHEAMRVIVCDVGQPVGLIVDKVSRVLHVDAAQVDTDELVNASIAAKLITGVAKNIDGHDLIQLLDVRTIVEHSFSSQFVDSAKVGAATGVGDLTANRSSDDDGGDGAQQLVSFIVDDQEYAFEIAEVEQIVRIPDSITQVPHTAGHVLGLVNLRGRLLPLVSLRRMFRFAERELDENNRILVVTLGNEHQHQQAVGIVVDQMREVLRAAPEVQDKLPALLRQDGNGDEITAVCRLEGGKRLVSVLSAQVLFQHPAIQQAFAVRDQEIEENGMQDHDDPSELAGEGDTQLVIFMLAEQEFAVKIESVQEITRVSDQMTQVPKTPAFIEGLVNLRGSVLPVLNMRTRFGLPRIERNDRQRILVLDLQGTRTGFITDAVVEVLRLSQGVIEQAPRLSDEQTRLMGKLINLRDQDRLIQVLDVTQLLSEHERSAVNEAAA